MTALFPLSSPRKGTAAMERGTDKCDVCMRTIHLSRDTYERRWMGEFLHLRCEQCAFPDGETLKGDASEVNRQMTPADRRRINVAWEAEQAKKTPAPRDRSDIAFKVVGILIAVAIIVAAVVAAVVK